MNNNNGLSKTRLYTIFSGMKQRCYNPNAEHFKFYGGRGIAICDEWMGEHGVNNFIEWALNNGYEEHLTIDRIDPDGDYSPTNCQWITQSENSSRARHTAKPHVHLKSPGLNYKIDVLSALKEKGYNTNRLRKEKLLGESTIQQLREGKLVSWTNIDRICTLLECQPGDIVEHIK